MTSGPRDSIADVPGIRVGHRTIVAGGHRTGVTAIVPHAGSLFAEKLPAACDVLNGFGKSVGLMQVNELGTLETPILLTNTFAVAACAAALIQRALREAPGIGRTTSTVNPVVLECNDGYLNDIQSMVVSCDDAHAALESASEEFAVGSVGAGTGMSAFGFKAGIGTASRGLTLDGVRYHLGALVLANFGRAGDLRLPDGGRVGPRPDVPGAGAPGPGAPEAGSCIVVLATDVPLEHRQLRRVARRAGAGLAWCGSFWGHGSGDVFLAFSTAYRLPHAPAQDLLPIRVLAESRIDRLFLAAAEATQAAVLGALRAAGPMVGRDGHSRPSLGEFT
jgi:D-aminopeptidase